MSIFNRFLKSITLLIICSALVLILGFNHFKSTPNDCSYMKPNAVNQEATIREVINTITSSPKHDSPIENKHFNLIFSHDNRVISVYDDDRYFSFDSAKKEYLPNLIPPILHVEWKSERLPNFAEETLKNWRRLHPHWKIMLWTDKTLDEFAKDVLHPELLTVYNSFSEVIKKADMMRYVILYHYGGAYADIDQMPDKSLDVLRKHSCIIAREPEPYFISLDFNNALLASIHFMMSRPKHPFWLHILHEVKISKETGILPRTGPLMMTRSLKLYAEYKRYVDFGDSVFVAPSIYFYPPPNQLGDLVHLNLLRDVCAPMRVGRIKSYKDKICQLYLSKNQIDWSDAYKHKRYHNGSFGHHLMYHSWSGFPDINVEHHAHIRSIIPDYLIYKTTGDNPHKEPLYNAFENEQKLLTKYLD